MLLKYRIKRNNIFTQIYNKIEKGEKSYDKSNVNPGAKSQVKVNDREK